MPHPEPEPENYSIDDMMERLRTRGEGGTDGEPKLVTRDDGTQVYKLRKRKRRSRQPKKEKEKRHRRFRVAQVVLAVGLLSAAGLAAVGGVIYLNSPSYHKTVTDRIRLWTGAEPQLTQFRVSPVSVAAGTVELKWPESSMLRSLKVAGARGGLQATSLVGGTWKGSEILSAQSGTLVLDRPTAPSAAVPGVGRAGDCPFQFRFRASKFNVLLGGEERPALRLTDAEVSYALLDPAATMANLQFEGGTMQIAGMGNFGLTFASFQFEPGGIRVGNIRLAPVADSGAEIEIVNPRAVPLDLNGGDTELAIRFQRLPLATLLGPAFGTWLGAEIETPEDGGDGTIRFNPGNGASFSCRIPFQSTVSSDTRGSKLPMFGIIAREIREMWYQAPGFDLGAAGVLVKDGESSGLEDLKLESRAGRLIVTGKVAADATGNLDGTLEVGLPEASLNVTSSPFRAVFKRRDGVHAWATIRISGAGRQPQDDLQKQLDAAAVNVPPAAGGNESLEDAFRELTTPDAR